MNFPGLSRSLSEVRDQIRHHQAIGGWSHSVRIVAVTKSQGPDAVRAALAAGLMDVGENRVQEALAKQTQLTGVAARWHLIGSLQRNKVRHVVGRFDLIHSVDRVELVQELTRRIPEGSSQSVLVQVNCSDEAQKGGVEPAALSALLELVRASPRLQLLGLMTLAAESPDERVQRSAFGRLRALRDELEARGFQLPELSMGMSADFAVAVEEGATLVRLGTLLFGARPR
jgi:PLP dependent protein